MSPTRTATITLTILLAATGCATTEMRSAPDAPGVDIAGDPASFGFTSGPDAVADDDAALTTTVVPLAEPVTTDASDATSPSSVVTAPPAGPLPATQAEAEAGPDAGRDDVEPATTVPTTEPPVEVDPPRTPTTVPPVKVPVTHPSITIPPVLSGLPTPDCGVFGDIPGDSAFVETMFIDVDDDGQVDVVTTYFAAIGDSGGWRLRTEIQGGPIDDVAIEGVGPGVARILGAVEADRLVVDPATWRPELLVLAGANASGPNLTVFGVHDDGCLFRFEDEVGADLVLPIHQSIGSLSGLRCDAVAGQQFLVRLEAEQSIGTSYDAIETVLDRDGDALVPSNVLASEIDSDAQAEWLGQFGELNCSGITI